MAQTKRLPLTSLQRMGLDDGDLKTPGHDAIMLWLDSYLRSDPFHVLATIADWRSPSACWRRDAKTCLAAWKGQQERYLKGLTEEARGRISADVKSRYESLRAALEPVPTPYCECRLVTWERPIMSGTFMVGYVDLYARIVIQEPSIDDPPRWFSYPVSHDYAFEVKTKLPSLGELIRQIRTYQHYERDWTWIIVCPDDRFAEPLAQQGIWFLKAP